MPMYEGPCDVLKKQTFIIIEPNPTRRNIHMNKTLWECHHILHAFGGQPLFYAIFRRETPQPATT